MYQLILQITSACLLTLFYIFCIHYSYKIKTKTLRYSTLSLLLLMLLYNVLISAVRLPNLDYDIAHIFSHLIFLTAYLFFESLLIFNFFFLKASYRPHKFFFIFFTLANISLIILSFTPLLENGLEMVNGQYKPKYGKLSPVVTSFYLLFLIYLIYTYKKAYSKTKDSFVRKQIRLISIALGVSLGITYISNGILPTYFNNSNYHFISQFSFIFLAYTFLSLLLNYQFSTIKKYFQKILHLPTFQKNHTNVIALQSLMQTLHNSLKKGEKHQLEERFVFHIQNQGDKVFYLNTQDANKLKSKENQPMQFIPFQSYIESLNRLERENLSIGLQLQMCNEIMNECVPHKKLQEYENRRTAIEKTFLLLESKDGLTPLEHTERREILRYLHRNDYKKLVTAKELGITLNTLKAKLKKYKIPILKDNLKIRQMANAHYKFLDNFIQNKNKK